MDAVSQIKQSLDIVDVIGGYVQLTKSGRNYKGSCPFHGENTPSFMVSPDLQIYKCFGCGAGGDMFSFIEHIEGYEFPKALEVLAERAGVTLEKNFYDPTSKLKKKIYEINFLAAKLYHHILTSHKAGSVALKYAKKKRGLSDATIKDFMVGYAPDSWNVLYKFLDKNNVSPPDMIASGLVISKKSGDGYIDKFRGRVMFPLMGIDGKIVGFTGRDIVDRDPKYLNSPETPVFYKSSYIFGLDKSRLDIKTHGAVFVEGQLDVLSAHQNGIKNVIASSGTSLTLQQLKILSRYTKDITFCFDSDDAGIRASYRAIRLAEQQDFNVTVAVIPAPHKDLDELLQDNVPLAKDILSNPVPIYDYFLATAIKSFDKTTALGKKQIVSQLAPYYSQISNPVVFDHYIKKVSEELDLGEDSIREIFTSRSDKETSVSIDKLDAPDTSPVSPLESKDAYFLSLLLHSDIDTINKFIYKSGLEYVSSPKVLELLKLLQKLVAKKQATFEVKAFSDMLEDSQKDFLSEVFLIDLGETIENQHDLIEELHAVQDSLERSYLKKELVSLSKKIRLAEMENAQKDIDKFTREFSILSKKLKD